MSPPTPAWSERSTALAQLLSRVAIGDRQAFEALYGATHAHLFGVILRINSNSAQAEDVLQEVFINVWRAAQGFEAARSQPMTWLTSIARNRAIDSLRRRKTEVATTSTRVARDGDDDDDLLNALPSQDAGPLELLQQAAAARAVTRCVDQLKPEQQQCVALAYYQGLSHAEVAQQLQQPLGTVKSWVRRALLTLKECLGHPSSELAGGK